MANLNEIRLIGRLTRDPETRTFANGGKVTQFGFAVNNRKKVNGEWEDSAMFIEVKAFNRDNGRKMADLVEQYLSKGSQVFIGGHLDLEQWEDKNGGGKRQKHVVILDNVQFLDKKQDDDEGGSGYKEQGGGRSTYRAPANASAEQPRDTGGDDHIPF